MYIPVEPQFHGRTAEVVSLEPRSSRPGWPMWQLFKTCANNQEGGREGGNKERREGRKRSSFNPGQLETKIQFPSVKLCPRIHNAESNGNGRAKNAWQ